MEALFQDASLTGAIVILTDPNGVVLFSVGKGDFAELAAGVALRPGATWDEGTIGTNAIGTALAERQPISAIGGEHFFDLHKVLSCSAAPILDPCGVVVGVLDLTNASEVPLTHTLALVRRAVEQIEHRLFESRFAGHERMCFHADPYLIGSSHEGLFAFDGDRLIGANRQGLGGSIRPASARRVPFRRIVHYRPGQHQSQPGVGRLRRSDQERPDPVRAHAGGAARSRRSNGRGRSGADLQTQQNAPDLCQIIDRLLRGPLGGRSTPGG